MHNTLFIDATMAEDRFQINEPLLTFGNFEKKDEEENTDLFLAAKYGRTEIALMLIKNGANVNEKNKYEKTARDTKPGNACLRAYKKLRNLSLLGGEKSMPFFYKKLRIIAVVLLKKIRKNLTFFLDFFPLLTCY